MTFVAAGAMSGCGYNDIQRVDEASKQAWAEVLNQYKRRADLIDNLVKTVQGYADHERDVLTQVTDARARVGQISVDPSDPASLKQFESAQANVQSALSRLLVVSENYPQLKADQNFRELQAQLEGTENRIAVARNRFIGSVNDYNVLVRQFPVNLTAMAFGYKTKPQFSVEDEGAISKPPSVEFGRSQSAPAPSTSAGSQSPPALPGSPQLPAPGQPPALPGNSQSTPSTQPALPPGTQPAPAQ